MLSCAKVNFQDFTGSNTRNTANCNVTLCLGTYATCCSVVTVRWLHVSSDAADSCGALVSRLTRFLLVLHRRRHRRRREKRSYLLPLSGEGVNDNGTVASACTVALVMESRVREATGRAGRPGVPSVRVAQGPRILGAPNLLILFRPSVN
jgi:hypothetical protein